MNTNNNTNLKSKNYINEKLYFSLLSLFPYTFLTQFVLDRVMSFVSGTNRFKCDTVSFGVFIHLLSGRCQLELTANRLACSHFLQSDATVVMWEIVRLMKCDENGSRCIRLQRRWHVAILLFSACGHG